MRINCRVCGGDVEAALDLGRQPTANGFLRPDEIESELFFRLAVGRCDRCTTVQLLEEVKQEVRYHDGYRYQASGSAGHRRHFAENARRFMDTELTGPDPFIVEIGCNDGVMLAAIAEAGVRHLGVEPSGNVARVAAAKGVRVLGEFFDETTAKAVRDGDGPADVIFGANTICHISHIGSVFRGVDALLADGGVFVFEEPYLGTIVDRTAFDQIYDEHIFYFTVRSVQAIAAHYGFELVDAEPIWMHGGEIRYTIARPGRRVPSASVARLLAEEHARGLNEPETLERLRVIVEGVREDLTDLLRRLKAQGRRVVGYGAPAKCTTVTNFCGIGPELLPYVCDSTPEKQGHLVPGSHIPVLPPEVFAADYPDYAVLFAWNHAEEIMAKETGFTEAGGRWILYIPTVHVPGG
ncbi:class I SAM-dependent methyltransferase [Rhizohabitans arisaemae]|uniref:class I SAM-dependent methyltransferase n=1 Tax=Rhizohabitans arisaemae TaxID=2720610 RepID=UPI0024B140DB|nr:class I SAM-dependent methyltransferase [Rhizohabitans arisaemae]